jgi:hypothetical protein
VWFNIASAFSCVMLSTPPAGVPFAQVLWTKLSLTYNFLSRLPTTLRYRKRAYQGTQCLFFEDAELDRKRYAIR